MVSTGDTKGVEFVTLHSLNSLEQRELLNVVDKLRAQGLSAFTALPQLIVCGDQSSGKSSVLAALSELPFPRKDNLCTRFATEVILRRSEELSIAVSIGPGIGQPSEEQHKSFAKLVKSKDEFPAIFESAQAAMGLVKLGPKGTIFGSRAFSENILRIEIKGPTYPQLTIVDLPGLIHTETKTQTAEDVAMVSKLVREYMLNPKSIILAVVSAKNDIANQIVLQKAREIDREGLRTLGIITKPDRLHPGSKNEEAFLDLARNEEVKFKQGWHVVKNQDLGFVDADVGDRDQEEADFFRDSNFGKLPSTNIGIAALRTRLSKVLFEQVRTELPNLVRDIEGKLSHCKSELDKLGTTLPTVQDQRIFLLNLSQDFQVLCHSAVEGSYHLPFFGEGLSEAAAEKRLRACVRNLEMDFAGNIQTKGAKWTIVTNQQKGSHFGLKSGKRTQWTREQAVDHVLKLLKANRGQELPGLPSSRLVGTAFREYSSPWEGFARDHIIKVWIAARQFLERAFEHLTVSQTCKSLLEHWIGPKMDMALAEANKQLDALLQVHKREPMTTNHYFTDTAYTLKQERMKEATIAKIRSLKISEGGITEQVLLDVLDAVNNAAEPDMDRSAAEAALDNMNAFYKTAMKLFIDNVPTLVTEVAIISPLPTLFQPKDVLAMTEQEVSAITAESKENKARRDELTSQLTVLKDGARTCKEYATYRSALHAELEEEGVAHEEASEHQNRSQQAAEDGLLDLPFGKETEEEEGVFPKIPTKSKSKASDIPPPPPAVAWKDERFANLYDRFDATGAGSKKHTKKAPKASKETPLWEPDEKAE